jgi:hypothetical protein
MIVVIVAAAILCSAPIAAALVVSVASRREEANWSLGGPAQSLLEATARRIVGFHADSVDWPVSRARWLAQAQQRASLPEQIEAPTGAGKPA